MISGAIRVAPETVLSVAAAGVLVVQAANAAAERGCGGDRAATIYGFDHTLPPIAPEDGGALPPPSSLLPRRLAHRAVTHNPHRRSTARTPPTPAIPLPEDAIDPRAIV